MKKITTLLMTMLFACLFSNVYGQSWFITVSNDITPSYNGVLFYNDPQPTFTYKLKNTGTGSQTGVLHVIVRKDDGTETVILQESKTLGANQTFTGTLSLPTNELGFTQVKAWVTNTGSNAVLSQGDQGLSVVSQPRNYNQWDPDCFVGGTYVNEVDAGNRLGFKFERFYVKWESVEATQGSFDWSALTNATQDLAAGKILAVPAIRVETWPSWAPVWDDTPGASNATFLNAWGNMVKKTVEKLIAMNISVGAYMIGAEPARSLGSKKGLWLRKGGLCYAAMLDRAITEINQTVHANIPKIAFSTTRLHITAKDSFIRQTHETAIQPYQYISHHPYPATQNIESGTGASMSGWDAPNFPDNYDVTSVWDANFPYAYQKAQDMSSQFGSGIVNMFNTEVGYEVRGDYDLLSPQLRMHAAFIAQTYCVARATPNVKKLLWYCFRYGGATKGFNVTGSASARPAASTIATNNNLLYHANTGEYICNRKDLAIIRYDKPADNETVFALFRYNGLSSFSSSITSSSDVYNSYGRKVASGNFNQQLGVFPYYITVPTAQANTVENNLYASANVVEESVIWVERFNSGLGKMNASNSGVTISNDPLNTWEGTKSAKLLGANAIITSDDIDISTQSKIRLEFWYIAQNMDYNQNDRIKMEYYTTATGWTTFEDTKFEKAHIEDHFHNPVYEFMPSDFSFGTDFKIRITNTGNDADDVIFIDAVRIYAPVSAQSSNPLVHILKNNDSGFALDGGNTTTNGQPVVLWNANPSNVNQQWEEIDNGGGYYSYQKKNTNHCIDGGNGGAKGQDIYLWPCDNSNYNQQWKKISLPNNTFRLEKRNASGFSIDGSSPPATKGDSIYLWNSNNNNANQKWIINVVGSANKSAIEKKNIADQTNEENVVNIYPSPVNSKLTVHLTSESSTINLYNALGMLVGSKIASKGRVEMEMGHLLAGVYLVKVSSEIGVVTKTIIKE
ncbi:RICIN domain-containing protein [uncultured Polaribacter sp.]|uniref:ricin-type beta-trefoil lectin domain protein n=1 Tax=uncultured Polaribacter sp. TaxID=174711 RepID=UPI002624317F|nr:RICIN domain-containing protein [uncultured Polaribacter sp.]